MSIITHYTVAEGGNWREWPEDKPKYIPKTRFLNMKRATYFTLPNFPGRLIELRGITLHAFKCDDGNNGRIWDALNGWRDHDNAE